jgi:hypothetical protein|tara:strand:- start:194 stop:403 length:210 start_codon:yes stop_codon:yes gene_type:complete
MDINLCINHLGLNANQYRLTQSPPPHEFVEWNGSDPQPTQAELETAWAAIEADPDYQAFLADRTLGYPK